MSFPGVSVVKNLPANGGDPGSIPVSARSPGGGHNYPIHYSCLENYMDRRYWWAPSLLPSTWYFPIITLPFMCGLNTMPKRTNDFTLSKQFRNYLLIQCLKLFTDHLRKRSNTRWHWIYPNLQLQSLTGKLPI